MDAHLLSNALAYSAQVAALAALGTLVSLVIRLDSAPLRYAYWRALLVLCLILPWLQHRVPVAPQNGLADGSVSIVAESAAVTLTTATGSPIPWAPIVASILAAGIVVRVIWIAVGLVRLKRLRGAGQAAEPVTALEELQGLVGTRAQVRYVPELVQPMTFGVRRPVILLPDRVREQPDEVQRAVLTHELLHVKRRDWLWLLVEEALSAALWFHPAVWWLIARVQLAREEVVDARAVSLLGARRPYIQALMAFADETPLTLAPAFARRHHLFRRIVLISKEAAMSPRRVVFTCLLVALIVAGSTVFVVRAFPLIDLASAQQPATIEQQATSLQPQLRQSATQQLEQRVNPVTPENPIPRRLSSVDPAYPGQYLGSGIRARVSVRLVLDASGAVAEARVLSADVMSGARPSGLNEVVDLEPFRIAAVDAARRWLYQPPANPPIAFTAVFTFQEGATQSSQAQTAAAFNRVPLPAQPNGGRRGAVPRPAPGPQGVQAPGVPGGSATPGPPAAGAPIRVGGNVRPPQQVTRVNPEYPPIALGARVQGVVILELQIEVDGSVTDARVLRSIPLLDRAALDAVMQWRYVPTLLNGVPVPVLMTVTVQFMLPEAEPGQSPAN